MDDATATEERPMPAVDDKAATAPRPILRRWWVWALAGAVVVAAGSALAFGYFGVHKLFIDDVVDEAGPVFESGASGDDAPADPDTRTDPPAGDDAPVVTTLATGTFDGVGRYSGAGTAVVLGDGTGQRFVRFEDDFSTSNGPDLFVYLGTGSGEYGDPGEYIELGRLSGNIGSQNYEIPAVHPETGEPIDLDRFDHVEVWCKRFSSTFAVAPLAA